MQIIDRYFGKIVWILTGICFAAAASLMLISGTFHLDCFYDVGKVYDVPSSNLVQNGSIDWKVSSEAELINIGVLTENNWKYIYIALEQMEKDSFFADINFYNGKSELVYQTEAEFFEGSNLITLPDFIYNRFHIIIRDQAGLSFRLKQIQLREMPPVFSMQRYMKYLLFIFVGFLFITSILYRCIKRKLNRFSWYALVQGLQTLFLYVGRSGENLCKRYSAEKKGLVRTGLFCFLFLFMQVSFILNFYFNKETYRYLILVCVLVLILIAFLCWEKPLHYLNWKNKLAASWFVLWGLAVVSNFIVRKNFAHTGFCMIFVVGFLFFMWGNMEHREFLLRDFNRGIMWSFFPNILFCYLFRPYLPGFRYIGATYSPGVFALYLLFVWLAFLSALDFQIKNRNSFFKDLFCIFILGICGDLMWKTQSISSVIPAVLAALVFSYKLWKKRKQVKILGFAAYLFIFGIGYVADGYCVYHIPRLVNAEIKFKKDVYQDMVAEHPFMLTVKAEDEEKNSRILNKIKEGVSLESLTSGRTLYWKAYLREINLWGHKGLAKFFGGSRMPHNGFIAIMYRYGIFSIVPYLMVTLYNFWFALRYFKKHLSDSKNAFFVLANVICCSLLLFVENLELPFGWICWYGMYIVMGVYFDDEKILESDSKIYLSNNYR